MGTIVAVCAVGFVCAYSFGLSERRRSEAANERAYRRALQDRMRAEIEDAGAEERAYYRRVGEAARSGGAAIRPPRPPDEALSEAGVSGESAAPAHGPEGADRGP